MSETLRLGSAPRRLDLEVVEQGVRREAPMAPGVFFRILPWGDHNKRYRVAFQRAVANGRWAGDGLGENEAAEFMLGLQEEPEFIVDAVLADVEGLLNEKGNEIKYTRERGVQILADPEWAHLKRWVVMQSQVAAGIWKEEVEHSGNGSRPSSSGKKGGAAKSAKTKSS